MRTSVEPQSGLLFNPPEWQIGALRQPLSGEVDGMGSGEDRRDDVRGKEGQGYQVTHVTIADAFLFSDLGDGPDAAVYDVYVVRCSQTLDHFSSKALSLPFAATGPDSGLR